MRIDSGAVSFLGCPRLSQEGGSMASFVERVVGAARLDVRTYEEVEADVHKEPAPVVSYVDYPSLHVATAPAASTEVRGVELQTNL